jgi:hypothetical protein
VLSDHERVRLDQIRLQLRVAAVVLIAGHRLAGK